MFVLLLWVAYRSWKAPLLGGLPLASAGLAGLGAVALAFDGVHGITVAFGFTLIGVVQDYPIHLFSHQRAGVSPWASARALWPTLGTGVASLPYHHPLMVADRWVLLDHLNEVTVAERPP